MRKKKERKESAEEYAERFFGQGSFPLFEGVEPYQELFKAGRLLPFYNLIRVTLEGFVHLFYYTDEIGKLIRNDDPEYHTNDPGEILKGFWQLESIVPKKFSKPRE